MEHDCPPFLRTYRGMEEGAARFLDALEAEGIAATCFCTGDVVRRFPEVIARIVRDGHELACHGDTHRRFSTMDLAEARDEIARATVELSRFAPVSSFRAPNLDLPDRYLPLLAAERYRLDSSLATYMPHKGHPKRPVIAHGLLRVPVSTTPSSTRLPAPLRRFILRQQRDPVMLFFHPWEFVDVTTEPIPLDCRFRTGLPAVVALRAAIDFLRGRGGQFVTAAQLLPG